MNEKREYLEGLSQSMDKTFFYINYLDRIRALPCVICGRSECEAAHIRYSDAKAGKTNPGMGAKPDDRWCVPLCPGCHRGRKGQHTRGERQWWESKKKDPLKIAQGLWEAYGG